MSRQFLGGKVTLHGGDSREVLATLETSSVDSVVCDPPYGILFMGRAWDAADGAPFAVEFWVEVLRVLKPGGHLSAFSGTRTYHRMACAIEDAGFEIRDQLAWAYGSGFPKSLDVSKALDKAAGAEREVVGFHARDDLRKNSAGFRNLHDDAEDRGRIALTAPATPAARQWQGYGTALKPAWEPIVLARKPLIGTVAQNVTTHGVGALNIDATRIGVETWDNELSLCASCADLAGQSARHTTPATKGSTATRLAAPTTNGRGALHLADTDRMGIGCSDGTSAASTSTSSSTGPSGSKSTGQSPAGTKSTTSTETRGTIGWKICSSCGASTTDSITSASTTAEARNSPHDGSRPAPTAPVGRWPANLIHDGSEEVVALFPEANNGTGGAARSSIGGNGTYGGGVARVPVGFDDQGSAARFFYTSKADADDRLGSKHPTVKPVDLMQWLVRLVTPKNGTCLDPFAGTGTTGEAAWREGCRAILIEREEEYQADIARRMELAEKPTKRAAVAASKNNLDDPNSLPLFGGWPVAAE
jgi:DNA modification methylase